jgi:flagellar protein FliO/FliZ
MNPRAAGAGLLTPLSAFAEEAGRTAAKPAFAIDLLQWSAGLLLVLAMIGFLALLLRRMGNFSRLEVGRFQVLAALSVGTRERVVLVQAGDKQLVLGVAPGQVQTLCILEGEEAIRPHPAGPRKGSFASRLADFWPERKP